MAIHQERGFAALKTTHTEDDDRSADQGRGLRRGIKKEPGGLVQAPGPVNSRQPRKPLDFIQDFS
ncbi:MAG: hypothetical protein LBM75_05420 [Myxococcales bacterium]|jgi:hypothetical protein|nr:hypothetical protein [Myxococcales bacterium]